MVMFKDIKPMKEYNNIIKYCKTLRTHLTTNTIYNNRDDLKDKVMNDEFKIQDMMNSIKYQRGDIKQLDYCNKFRSLRTVYRTLSKLYDDYM